MCEVLTTMNSRKTRIDTSGTEPNFLKLIEIYKKNKKNFLKKYVLDLSSQIYQICIFMVIWCQLNRISTISTNILNNKIQSHDMCLDCHK